MIDSGKIDENDSLDFDNLLCDSLPDDLYMFFDDVGEISNNAAGATLSVGEIEKLLLDDNLEPLPDNDTDAFLSELLVDSPLMVEAGSDCSSYGRDCSPPESEKKGHNSPSDSDEKVHDQEEQNHNHVGNNDALDDDDPIKKKRRRQLRNRDAAVRSRERKKMYVKDLEMKSRFYEAECRRLQWMLQCVQAENHALQFALNSNNEAFGTCSTKQESAVLFVESLLLGSLLWLVGIIGLFILPKQLLSILDAALLESAEEKNQTSLAAPGRMRSSNVSGVFQSLMKSKRWRGSRTRMKVWSRILCKCHNVCLPIVP